jgi:hypothetical protein
MVFDAFSKHLEQHPKRQVVEQLGRKAETWATAIELWHLARTQIPTENDAQHIGRNIAAKLNQLAGGLDQRHKTMMHRIQSWLVSVVLPGMDSNDKDAMEKVEFVSWQYDLWQIKDKTMGELQYMSVLADARAKQARQQWKNAQDAEWKIWLAEAILKGVGKARKCAKHKPIPLDLSVVQGQVRLEVQEQMDLRVGFWTKWCIWAFAKLLVASNRSDEIKVEASSAGLESDLTEAAT